MNLLPAWRDSLTILQPKNFKLFFLVTLKTMVDTFKVWIKYFWWLIVLPLLPITLLLLNQSTRVEIFGLFANIRNAMPSLVYYMMPSLMDIVLVTILLAARPSVALKNCAYFRSYFWRALLLMLVVRLPDMGSEMILGIYIQTFLASPFLFRVAAIIQMLCKVYAINYALFLLDSDGSIRSFFRSFMHTAKMVIFNLPFYLISVISFLLLIFTNIMLAQWSAGDGIFSKAVIVIHVLIFLVLDFFKYCFYTNFYIKKLHDQFTLYFGKNE